jgi:hypothetical protein
MIANISTSQLFIQLKELRKTERHTLAQIITHLQEIQRRRAYAKKGYSTLFKYLTRELGYSDSAAGRRMQALKLVKRAPKSKKMIQTGELNLSTVSKVNQFLDHQDDLKENESVLEKFRGKTAAESDAILGEAGLVQPKREVKRRMNDEEMRVTMNLKKVTHEKFEKLKNLLKHNNSDSILNEICDQALNRIERENQKRNKSKGSKNNRYFPAAVKKAALHRAGFTCEYQNCDEQRGLEFDHLRAAGIGGTNELRNCRVLCKSHNQLAAIEVFGQVKMDRYL